MMKKTIYLAVITALLIIGVALSQEIQEAQKIQENRYTADRHNGYGITCGGCHGGEAAPKTAAPPKSCLVCKGHDSWNTVAERTSAAREYKFNPHRNHITETNDLECIQCHQAHRSDTVACYDCHTGMKFK